MFGLVKNVATRLWNATETFEPKFPEAEDWNFFIVRKSYFTEQELIKLRNNLIAISKYDDNKRFAMYNEDSNFFYLPRYYFKNRNQLVGNWIDRTDKGNKLKFTSNIKLWDYQKTAIEEFKKHIADGKTGIFLGAAPGSGKTQMGIEMMKILGRTTLIVVPKKDLIHQWIERIVSATDIKREDIGICQNGKIEWEGKSIVVGLVHTIVKYIDVTPFKTNFGVVIFDEVDSSVPPKTFAPAAVMFTSKYRICMTASKTRADGLHIIFQNHLVEVEINCSSSNTMAPEALEIEYTKSSGKLPYSKDRVAMKGMLLSLLAGNQDRNKVIADYTNRAAIIEERPTVVLSDRISQLEAIKELLTKIYSINPNKIGFYIGENNKDKNKQVADKCDIILGTYGMLSRGTDIPRLSCLILATPRNDMRQISGRIERVAPNKKTPIVVDIIDTAYNMCISGGRQRYKFYKDRGLKIWSITK